MTNLFFFRGSFLFFALLSVVFSCSTLPDVPYEKFSYPKGVYSGKPKRPYKVLGEVKARVEFPTLDMNREEDRLCENYFKKALTDLLKYAKDAGGDAVVEAKSVTFLLGGKMETHDKAECSDDGADGQILARGFAIKWLPDPNRPQGNQVVPQSAPSVSPK
jgi:hypothetical protein